MCTSSPHGTTSQRCSMALHQAHCIRCSASWGTASGAPRQCSCSPHHQAHCIRCSTASGAPSAPCSVLRLWPPGKLPRRIAAQKLLLGTCPACTGCTTWLLPVTCSCPKCTRLACSTVLLSLRLAQFVALACPWLCAFPKLIHQPCVELHGRGSGLNSLSM